MARGILPGWNLELARKALPEVAGFQAFLSGRVWGFGDTSGSLWSRGGPFTKRSGVLAVPGELDAVPRGEDHIRAPMVDHGRRQQTEPDVVVLLVVPVEEGPAKGPCVLGRAEAVREPGPVLECLELGLGEGLSSET